ncbi:MAG: mercury methylation ferredoxin HgcB [Spirochaetota bacterium]
MKYLLNVVSLKLDTARCNGCGKCVEVCPRDVFKIESGKAFVINRDLCIECGACALNCEQKAITVNEGVGCASALMKSKLTGEEPSCGCSENCCC